MWLSIVILLCCDMIMLPFMLSYSSWLCDVCIILWNFFSVYISTTSLSFLEICSIALYILAPHILLDLVLWRVGISCMTKYNCSPFFPSCSFIHMRCSRTYHYISLYFLCVALYTNGVWPTLETISLDESGKQRSDTYRLKGETNRHYTKKRSRLASTSLDPTTGFGCAFVQFFVFFEFW